MTTATITINREHRDAIYQEIESIVRLGDDLPRYLADAALEDRARDWIREYPRRLAVTARLLDALGWEEHGIRDSYVLEIDAEIARFMVELEQSTLGCLKDNSGSLDDERRAAAKFGQAYTEEEWTERCAQLRAEQDGLLDGLDVARRAQASYRETRA